ncbi:MAG: Sir2 family NAD-dependent protein deacetylase [Pirellulales bacterium]|nr:Sir2 family NAD-dependent protein deacetylase [Pirellulales bacterium]
MMWRQVIILLLTTAALPRYSGTVVSSHLDPAMTTTESKLATLATWIHGATTVVWFTGAGISTESGLPDYRGPDGVWTRRDRGLPPPRPTKRLSEIKPNPAHRAIVEFEKIGKCSFLISQNVDNLHLESGYPFDKLAELHGNKNRLRCRPCDKTFAVSDLVAMPKRKKSRIRRDLSYECPECGGPLVSSIINFGDAMPESAVDLAFQWADQADLMIVVGSSCQVLPAAEIPRATKNHGGRLVVINIGETGVDDICDLRFDCEKAGKLLPELLLRVKTTQ